MHSGNNFDCGNCTAAICLTLFWNDNSVSAHIDEGRQMVRCMDMLGRKVLRLLILALPLAVLMQLSAVNQASAHTAMDHASAAGQAQYQTIGDLGAVFADREPQISDYELSGILPFADRTVCDGSSCCGLMCASSVHVTASIFFIHPLNSGRALLSNAAGPMSLHASGLERPPRSQFYAI